VTVVGVDPTYEPSCETMPFGPRPRWAKLEVPSCLHLVFLVAALLCSLFSIAALHGVLDGVAWALLMTGFDLSSLGAFSKWSSFFQHTPRMAALAGMFSQR